jgi:D-alanyl-D-alanine dipeptidase/carboxypeptidase
MNSLILVNLQHACPTDMVQDLVPVCENAPQILLEREAAVALARLMGELNGWRWIVPVSGWRSMEEQTEIYHHSLVENGQAFTEQYVALPGHSEHQTGLAIDLGLRQKNVDFLRPAFPYDGICQRFRQLAPTYGFVERYPAGKEGVTGIAHEPWHFRYVGTPHADNMARRGLTLEEYLV